MPGITPLHLSRLSRRSAVTGVAMALFGTRFHAVTARDATPEARPTGDDAAVALLNDAVAAMNDLETFAFTVVTARGETTVLEGFTLEEISGVVRRPADFETVVSVAIPMATLELTAVSVNDELWIELPTIEGISGGGWQSLGVGSGILSLVNPDVLILEAVQYIDDAEMDRDGEVDGVPVTYVTGFVDFRGIAAELVGDEMGLPTEIAEGPVRVTIAVDEASLVREIEIMGPLLTSESPDVIRVITFSDFDEPVEIREPDGTG